MRLLLLVLPALALIRVWLPEFLHYDVHEATITAAALASARLHPSDDTLREVREFYLFPVDNRQPALETRLAESILQGRLDIPDVTPGTFRLPFASTDLDSLGPGTRLWFAAFAVPDFLLAAHENTNREDFFVAARDFILAWDSYERRAWRPKGFLWNDHATAARVRVLGEFWRLYRNRADYDPQVGRVVLQQAARYGEFLLDPGHFTFATNHGVMQNIGLLHLSLAFPSLPRSAHYKQVAIARLDEQMAFFIDAQGVIREHSSGYQAFGLEMLGIAFRSLTLLGERVPDDWTRKYQLGLDFFAHLRRPDATLPTNGDTDGAPQTAMPRVTDIDAQGRAGRRHARERWQQEAGAILHAAAGYWVDWSGMTTTSSSPRQTLVTWTRQPPPAHKHADELNVLLWGDNVSWLTSVGYWPYGTEGRGEAESWGASNAPHLVGENPQSERAARALASGWRVGLAAVDLERAGPGTLLVRRQVVRAEPHMWIVIDHLRSPQATRTVWTWSPDVTVGPVEPNGWFTLAADRGVTTARATLLTSSAAPVKDYRGSYTPFAGWQVVHYTPQPTTAFVVDQPAGETWSLMVLSLAAATPGEPPRLSFSGPEEWTLALPLSAELRRRGEILSFTRGARAVSHLDTLRLTPVPDPTADLSAIRAAYRSAAAQYPRFQEHGPRRQKVTYLLLFLVLAQELTLLAVRRRTPRWSRPLRVAGVICWVGVATWLHFAFLPSWVVLTQ